MTQTMSTGFIAITGGVLALSAANLGVAAAAASKNMNGRYVVASGKDQGVPFNDDYASKGHEYFDVWAH